MRIIGEYTIPSYYSNEKEYIELFIPLFKEKIMKVIEKNITIDIKSEIGEWGVVLNTEVEIYTKEDIEKAVILHKEGYNYNEIIAELSENTNFITILK